MIAKAIEKILSLAAPEVANIGEEVYSKDVLIRLDKELRASPITVRNLSSLVMYIRDFHENRKELPLLVHVENEKTVTLLTALDGDRTGR